MSLRQKLIVLSNSPAAETKNYQGLVQRLLVISESNVRDKTPIKES